MCLLAFPILCNWLYIYKKGKRLLIFSRLDIVLETPIVVLPEAANSSNVLVAHLGQILIRNKMPLLKTKDNKDWEFFPIR